jgi:predicted nucleic acid-binding protein
MLYLDTSLLVAALTREERTADIQRWFGEQALDSLAISDWVATEFSAALAIKLRTRQIAADLRAEALALFSYPSSESLTVWPVSRFQFRAAARFADDYARGLRAGDALHVAICTDHGATLCTLDRRLSKAGPALGVKTTLF